jgi:hypothetical protein
MIKKWIKGREEVVNRNSIDSNTTNMSRDFKINKSSNKVTVKTSIVHGKCRMIVTNIINL